MKRWATMGLAALAAAAMSLSGSGPAARAQGGPGFSKHVVSVGQPASCIALGDFRGDGRLGVAAASAQELAWYERGPGKSFWLKHPVAVATDETGSLAAGALEVFDVDGDGRPDLIAAVPATGYLTWYENPGSTDAPWPRHLIDTLPGVRSVALEDLDRDSRPELIACYDGAVAWYHIPRRPRGLLPASYRGDPGGRPMWERKYLTRSGVGTDPGPMAFGDMDGDGDRDLCIASARSGALAWWERPADATLAWPRHLLRDDMTGATHLIPVDVDGDGKVDLLFARGRERGIGWLTGPDWREAHIIDSALQGPFQIAVGDVSGGGRQDVVAVCSDHPRVVLWENDGHGRFTRLDLDDQQYGEDLRLADVDGDGDLDIVVAGGVSKNLVWYENLRR